MHNNSGESMNKFDYSLDEWLSRLPNELAIDAVGMWQIIPVLRQQFNLEGDELVEWTRRGILALIARGAVPVKGSGQTKGWYQQHGYGATPQAMTEAIISEWQLTGEDPEPYDSLWFALESEIEANYG